ncbi:transglycosylase domain-containing protein [Psychroflexus sp. CAK8W]|uniref:Transglycosylase domain-containing protein n=1 Tax=Psychroflexus longus TaxID=2873596 RepID=A0ABS7XKR1_9FLAO|nr:transglycosylase domain-containing protein [Psychroflexus longus]MBZ9778547.1 transglycosylase domain-containing protein [Psychroflexus longus]
MSKTSTPKKGFKKYILGFWIVFFVGILSVIFIFLLASWGALGPMPTFEELENPETNLATEVISADGQTLGKYFKENRTPINYEDLPDHLINALVATEDERFYSHSGIDARGTLRAAIYLGKRGGASTITQQLSKLLFTDPNKSGTFNRIIQKVKEWVIAIRLEEQYTKNEIITMYLNKFDFLYQAVGIRSASRIYFSKEPKDLTVEESATLVAMLKNPILYNPVKDQFKENSEQRRNQVLKQMEKNGFINQKVKDSLQDLPLVTYFSPEEHDDGIATYFRAYVQEFMKDWIEDNPKPDGSSYSMYRDGLKIYTSVDYKMQAYAETAVEKHLKNLQKEFDRQNQNNKTAPFRSIDASEIESILKKGMRNSDRYKRMKRRGIEEDSIMATFNRKREMRLFSWNGPIDTLMTPKDSIRYYKSFLNTGMMSMTPQTGEIKAWVGGVNYKFFKYEHVKQAKRQVGSTFKPFVYATAIDQLHYSPCKEFPNTPYTIPKGKHGVTEDWTPSNAGGDDDYGGIKTLKQALAESINTITARVIDRTGPESVINLIDKLGIDTSRIQPVAAIALGTADISVYDMVSAYSAFANKGVYVKPYAIQRIEDKNGTILYQHQPQSRDVLSEEAAYVTIQLLEGVTQSGSGRRLKSNSDYAKNSEPYKRAVTGYPYAFENDIAGKTGTTQNQSDGWFIGMVPNLATGVWVGGEDRSVRFETIAYGQGATLALPIWGMYMKDIYADESLDVSKEKFERPDNLSIQVDCDEFSEDETGEEKEETTEFEIDF